MTTAKSQLPATQKGGTLKEILNSDKIRAQIALALPSHLKPDRFIRIATTALLRTPKLMQCDQASFFQALLNLSAMGLEPDGRRAHLIPFENKKRGIVECQLIVDYKGLVDLVRRSGEISSIHADVVYERDKFTFAYGSGQHLHHIPALQNRGKPIAAYSYVKLKDGSDDFIVMPVEEVEGIRKRSRAANDGPWVTDWPAMAAKTVFRRHSKWLPFSPELREQIEQDDEGFIDIDAQHLEPKAPAPARTAPKQTAEQDKGQEPEVERTVAEEQPEPEPEQTTAAEESW